MTKMMLLTILLLATSSFATRNLHAVHEDVSVQRTKDCPSGSELVGKQCVSTEVLQPNFVCPSGTTLLNGECATFTRAARICQQGQHYQVIVVLQLKLFLPHLFVIKEKFKVNNVALQLKFLQFVQLDFNNVMANVFDSLHNRRFALLDINYKANNVSDN